MKKTFCFNHTCNNFVSLEYPRHLYNAINRKLINKCFILNYKHIDTIVVNYKYIDEKTATIWLPTKYLNNITYSPFCNKHCAGNYIRMFNKEPNTKVILYNTDY